MSHIPPQFPRVKNRPLFSLPMSPQRMVWCIQQTGWPIGEVSRRLDVNENTVRQMARGLSRTRWRFGWNIWPAFTEHSRGRCSGMRNSARRQYSDVPRSRNGTGRHAPRGSRSQFAQNRTNSGHMPLQVGPYQISRPFAPPDAARAGNCRPRALRALRDHSRDGAIPR